MATNMTDVSSIMQGLAVNAITVAKDKFNVSLDYSENSLQQLEVLLQQAHEDYKQAASSVNFPSSPIENTVRVWGGYLGEVIRRSLGGEWIIYQKDVFLQLDTQRLDTLGQVRSRIMTGAQYNVQDYFKKLSNKPEEFQPLTADELLSPGPVVGNEPPAQETKSSGNKCPYCGTELPGGNFIFCPNCGKGLVDTPQEDKTMPEPVALKTNPNGFSMSRHALAGATIAAFLAIPWVLYYLYATTRGMGAGESYLAVVLGMAGGMEAYASEAIFVVLTRFILIFGLFWAPITALIALIKARKD
jgi:hypothetical protein